MKLITQTGELHTDPYNEETSTNVTQIRGMLVKEREQNY
jgi:hypothetical protein